MSIIDDLNEIDAILAEEELLVWTRADQNVVCQICTRRYGDHPLDRKTLDHEGNPFLHELCDGRLVKL